MNVLPLFHGHGLHATLVASLAAGASVVCTPGLDVSRFSGWLTAFQPTWYSAVPTMHQAILAQARHNRERLADSRLRFVRSSSAPLPPRIFAELEGAFETPVIEWYGMTEVTVLADRVQSAAAAPAQGGFGRAANGFGCRDHG